MHRLFLICGGLMASLLVSPCQATVYGEFSSWLELEEISPDIVLVECRTTPRPAIILDHVIRTEIDVLHALKGQSPTGHMALYSSHQPRQGERFLLFGNFQMKDGERRHIALEAFRVVPLGLHFSIDHLKDKPLNEQIQSMLDHRRKSVEMELKQLEKERERLQLSRLAPSKAAGTGSAEANK